MSKAGRSHQRNRFYSWVCLLLLAFDTGAMASAAAAGEPNFASLNEQSMAFENAVESKSKGGCKYAAVAGQVSVTRAEGPAVESADPGIECRDVGDGDTEAWLDMLQSYGNFHSYLQHHQEEGAQNYVVMAQSAYRVAKVYACASLRSGFDLVTASLEMIHLTESYGQKGGDGAVVKKAQELREILEKSSFVETKATPSSCLRRGYFTEIPDSTWQQMQGRSWHADKKCPERKNLALARIPFVGFDGKSRVGEMIVAKSVASKVLDAFSEIYNSGFRIEAMELIDKYDGDDRRSMAANNTSAFNCRSVTRGTSMSEHSTGRAIDLNPLQNPYVTPTLIEPAASAIYSKPSQRKKNPTGLIQKNSAVVSAFAKIGWKWGGSWNSGKKDYQHFSETGR